MPVDRLVAGVAQRLGAVLALGVANVGQHDAAAFPTEELCLRGALAPSSAGDESDLSTNASGHGALVGAPEEGQAERRGPRRAAAALDTEHRQDVDHCQRADVRQGGEELR